VVRSGGFQPWCVDLFADADLEHACATRAVPGEVYPGALLEPAREAPEGPWFYTGALENHPRLIDTLARERPLWGNAAAVVRRVRSPVRIAELLRQANLPCPALAGTRPSGEPAKWLLKPRFSAAGANIQRWRGHAIPRSFYLQEWIEGEACSALFVGRPDNSAQFLGATRQLIGLPWLHAGAFRYCGSVGPLILTTASHARVQQLGDVLAKAFCLRGFFGIDFILRDDVPWPVEINPRYTASIEVLERATGTGFFPYHREVFAPGGSSPRPISHGFCGKAILFAKDALCFPSEGPWQESLHRSWTQSEGPDYADIPHPRSRIEKGHPILTLFARAHREDDCLEILREKAQALDRRLFGG
jgi:predicted ATP-grasp superfamily ATP-dependent carboligase